MFLALSGFSLHLTRLSPISISMFFLRTPLFQRLGREPSAQLPRNSQGARGTGVPASTCWAQVQYDHPQRTQVVFLNYPPPFPSFPPGKHPGPPPRDSLCRGGEIAKPPPIPLLGSGVETLPVLVILSNGRQIFLSFSENLPISGLRRPQPDPPFCRETERPSSLHKSLLSF